MGLGTGNASFFGRGAAKLSPDWVLSGNDRQCLPPPADSRLGGRPAAEIGLIA